MLALRFLLIMFCFITSSLRLVNVALFLPNSGSLQSWKKQENHLRACEEGMLPGGTAIVITVPLLYLLTPVENRSHSRDPLLLNAFKKKQKQKTESIELNSYVIKILEGPFSFLIWIMHLVMILFYKKKCLLQGILSSSRQIAQSSCQTKCGFPVNTVNFSHAYFVSLSDGKWSD